MSLWTDEELEAVKPQPIREEVLVELFEAGWFDRPAPKLGDALCAGYEDPDLFFRTDNESVRQAKALCAECPALFRCHSWAEEAKEKHGTWAGKVRGGSKGQSIRGEAETCKRGHNEWGFRANGCRYCRACDRLRKTTTAAQPAA